DDGVRTPHTFYGDNRKRLRNPLRFEEVQITEDEFSGFALRSKPRTYRDYFALQVVRQFLHILDLPTGAGNNFVRHNGSAFGHVPSGGKGFESRIQYQLGEQNLALQSCTAKT